MHIDKTIFKPLVEQKKQRRLYLYHGNPSPIVRECPRKRGPHAACAICITNPQLEESENEHL
jgi:hypothetical protein